MLLRHRRVYGWRKFTRPVQLMLLLHECCVSRESIGVYMLCVNRANVLKLPARSFTFEPS